MTIRSELINNAFGRAVSTANQSHSPSAEKPTRTSLQLDGLELKLVDTLDAAHSDWQALQKIAKATIYQDFHWQKAWFETIGEANKLKPLIVIGRVAAKPIFILPLCISTASFSKTACFFGGAHANYKMPLIAPDHGELVKKHMHSILDWIGQVTPVPIDLFLFEQQPDYWDRIQNPVLALPHQPSINPGMSADLTDGFEALLKRGNAKRKRKILKRQEKQFAELSGYRVQAATSKEQTEELFDEFIKQKRNWFRNRGIKNPFEASENKRFFLKLIEYQQEQDETSCLLRFDYIEADNVIIALFGSGVFDNQQFGYFTAIHPDPKYATLSPGWLNLYKAIEAASDLGFRRFDLGVGEERYKNQWCDEHNQLFDVVVPVTFKGHVFSNALKRVAYAKRFVRKNKHLWKVAKNLRGIVLGSQGQK